MTEGHFDKGFGSGLIDKIGSWTEVKLDIIKRYATEYSKILSARKGLHHAYIDAFSGPGVHRKKISEDYVVGSPLNALSVKPPFEHHYFIDIDADKTSFLDAIVGQNEAVSIYNGDCNQVLISQILPRFVYQSYWRALCLLDPYSLQLHWKVVDYCAHLGTIDLFLNFPMHDINRNVVRIDPKDILESNIKRMDLFWGDNSWYDILYSTTTDLFGNTVEHRVAKANTALIQEYTKKLKASGFEYVAEPLPIKNNQHAVVYFLFFASNKPVAKKIVEYIFREWGMT